MNNFCNGIAATNINAPVGVCFNNNGDGEFFTCGTSPTPSRKISASSNIYPVNIINTTIDGNGSYQLINDYESIIIVFDKIANEWYRIGNG